MAISNFLTSIKLNLINSFVGLSLSMGLFPNWFGVDKYGENDDIDTNNTPQDITELGGMYIYDDVGTAPIVSLVSTNEEDTQDVIVSGLDIDGNYIEQTITLNGVIRVALDTPLWRVFRMKSAENPTTPQGDIFCYIGTSDTPEDNEKRAMIKSGNNQTLMAVFTVPKGYVGFLFRGEIGASRSRTTGAVTGSYYSRRYGQQFAVKKRIAVQMSGNSNYIDSRSFPDIIPSLTDIKLTIEEVTANNTAVFGTFDILMIPETFFSKAYLKKIGQVGY